MYVCKSVKLSRHFLCHSIRIPVVKKNWQPYILCTSEFNSLSLDDKLFMELSLWWRVTTIVQTGKKGGWSQNVYQHLGQCQQDAYEKNSSQLFQVHFSKKFWTRKRYFRNGWSWVVLTAAKRILGPRKGQLFLVSTLNILWTKFLIRGTYYLFWNVLCARVLSNHNAIEQTKLSLDVGKAITEAISLNINQSM